MPHNLYIFLAILVMAVVTAALRVGPFLAFKDKTPKVILYLGEVLPEAAIAMLVIYCLKGVSIFGGSHGIPEATAIVVVIVLHKIKHNVLLSILGGTIAYMALVQFIF